VSDSYFDSSALAKRYLQEIGTAWVRTLTDPTAGHTILTMEISQVEVAAALAARYRGGGITRRERDDAVDLLAAHCDREYQLVPTARAVLAAAVELTQRQRLRGYDAVQLATALVAAATLRAAGLPGMTFVAADADLVAAARAEGLVAADPHLHRWPARPSVRPHTLLLIYPFPRQRLSWPLRLSTRATRLADMRGGGLCWPIIHPARSQMDHEPAQPPDGERPLSAPPARTDRG